MLHFLKTVQEDDANYRFINFSLTLQETLMEIFCDLAIIEEPRLLKNILY